MTSPTHSVVVPVLNGERYIAEALRSALPQLGEFDEVLVVDNGSTDKTIEVVRALGDQRVQVLVAERKGPAAARNVALKVLGGRYVSFLDHDDYWPAGRLQGLVAALEAEQDANCAYGRLRVVVEPGCDDQGFSRIDGTHAPAVGLHVYLFRRELIEQAGLMDETLPLGSDVDYIARLRAAGMRPVAFDGDAAVYRRHSANITLDRAGKALGMMQVLSRNIARKRQQ